MRYMLLIHQDENIYKSSSQANVTAMSSDYAAFNEAMKKAGVLLSGERLQFTDTAASVRVADGRTEVLDGPYADTKEQFGGFDMIEAPDLDQAVAWAARCPAAQNGTVEVRPIWELTGN
jgi:hypothetical protein